MNKYKLLTPGPLTTTDTVKQEMLFDHCTWDDEYKKITLEIREQLLELAHADSDIYTVVLMQGSGTFGVESVFSSVVGANEKLLIAANGVYGERMEEIARHNQIPYECRWKMMLHITDAHSPGICDEQRNVKKTLAFYLEL